MTRKKSTPSTQEIPITTMKRSGGPLAPEKQCRVPIEEARIMEKSSAPLAHVHPRQLLYTSPPNGYHQYSPTSPHLPEHDEDHHMMALENTKAFHSHKSSARSSSGHQTKKSSSRKVKRKGGAIVKRFYN